MKLRAESNGHSFLLEIRPVDADARPAGNIAYSLKPLEDEPLAESEGTASVVEVMPGVFSILIGSESFLIRLTPGPDDSLEVLLGTQRFSIALGDLRDRPPRKKRASDTGPLELRAQMPGKVVKILVETGQHVAAGQGVIIVEAMKMQNEMKSPKDGVVARIATEEGATVVAGAALLVVE